MKARAIRLAAGPMGGRVRRKELRTPRLADQARTTAPRVAVFGNRAAREPHFDDVNSLKPNAHSSPPLLAKRRAHSLARRAPRSDRARHRLPSSRIFRSPLTAQAAGLTVLTRGMSPVQGRRFRQLPFRSPDGATSVLARRW